MPQPHTGKAIKDILLTTIMEFGIEKKLLAFSTDNASSMILGFNLLAAEMNTKFNCHIYHIRCSAHILNIIVQDGLKHMFDLEEELDEDQPTSPLTKLRLCINTIRRSPKLIDQLKEICQHLQEKYYNLPNDCSTRWSSTYDMIKIALKMKIPLQTLFITADIKHIKNALDYHEWTMLETNIIVFEIFATATNMLSAYTVPTLYQVEDVFNLIKNFLEKKKDNVYNTMFTKLQDYSSKLSDAYWII